MNTLKKIGKHTNKIHHFDLVMSYGTHLEIQELHQARSEQSIANQFLLFAETKLIRCASGIYMFSCCNYFVGQSCHSSERINVSHLIKYYRGFIVFKFAGIS